MSENTFQPGERVAFWGVRSQEPDIATVERVTPGGQVILSGATTRYRQGTGIQIGARDAWSHTSIGKLTPELERRAIRARRLLRVRYFSEWSKLSDERLAAVSDIIKAHSKEPQ